MAKPIEEENKYAQSLEEDLDIVKEQKKKASYNNIDTAPKKQSPIFRSMDDIEVIQRRNLEHIISQETAKSKDDLYIIEQERIQKLMNRGTNALKNHEQQPNSEHKAQANSRTSNILNRIKTSKTWGNIKKISNITGKILFNKTTASVLGLIASSIMLATIAPATAPFMFVSAAAMATSIVGKAIIDVVHTRKIRLLTQENKLLVKHRDDLSKQQALLKIDPKLKDILKDDLYIHNDPNQTKGKNTQNTKSLFIASVITNGISNIVNVAVVSAAIIGGGVAQIISSINIGLQSLKGSKDSVNQIQDRIKLIKELNHNINQEKQKTDIGNYKNIQELAEIGYKQAVQTEALTALLQDKNYFKFTDQEKQQRFNQLSKEITLRTALEYADTKKITSQNIIVDVLKDINRTHNPFYKQPEQITTHKSLLTKAVENTNTNDHKEYKTIQLKKKLELSGTENIVNRIGKQLINNNTISNKNTDTPNNYIKRITKKDLGLIR
ncbi:hypothetical protein [Rickettsia asembonensis]|uniref:Uncharacterized protein n=1 Tax=Rickettsia asembonensis TaxID=1068590 RepID=A0A0C2QYW2_9RICK|nr:hypothetical protein [Rickettsia asembonensis]KIJ88984.1 hypothetical protein SB78_02430 [Rickettsia asembonensis]